MRVYNTGSGIMFCKKYPEAERVYENVNEKFKKIREFTFEQPANIAATITKLQMRSGKVSTPDEITKRLYTPSPTAFKKTRIIEKYKDLFAFDTEA